MLAATGITTKATLGFIAGAAVGAAATSVSRWLWRPKNLTTKITYDLNPEGQKLRAGHLTAGFNKQPPPEKGAQMYVARVALTGGPCAGKSSSMQHLTQSLLKIGYDVYFVPEVPTVLMNGGCKYPGINGGKLLEEFEIALMSLQLQMERSFTTVAASTSRPSVLIMDRGLLDVKAYLPEPMWNQLIQHFNLTEEQILDRYDAVLHLVSAAAFNDSWQGADGAEQHYTVEMAEGTRRSEDAKAARELDKRVRQCWAKHPRLAVIDNSTSFPLKLQRATDEVVKVLRTLEKNNGQ